MTNDKNSLKLNGDVIAKQEVNENAHSITVVNTSQPASEEPEVILGVALACINKTTFKTIILQAQRPCRHHHLFPRKHDYLNKIGINTEARDYHTTWYELQGFYTNKISFIGRQEAKRLALKNGQYLTHDSNHNRLLFSEDLW